VLSDWIASNRELFATSYDGQASRDYAVVSSRIAKQAVARLGFMDEGKWVPGESFRDVWPKISAPNGLQQRIEEMCLEGVAPGLVIIESPMGEGKTEAAMYLATHWMASQDVAGFYMAMPTAATSNQMYDRLTKFLSQHDLVAAQSAKLVHGTSWMIDRFTPEQTPELHGGPSADAGAALDWFRPRKRTLLARNGIGTIDQAHMSVLHVRFGFLRLLGLAAKVLIVDEVHAYDAFMSEFLDHLLRWCSVLQVPVILLSATLSYERRQALIEAYAPQTCATVCADEYPLITLVEKSGTVKVQSEFATTVRRPVRIARHRGHLENPERIASVVAKQVLNGGCLGVIANTVVSAQRIYTALCNKLKDKGIEMMLFHARFPVARRMELEDEVLKRLDKRSLLDPSHEEFQPRPDRFVLVATQVVEQSLDLDFDELFSELAPVDLILQRIGRLWRHLERTDRKGRTEPVLHLFLPESPGGSVGLSGSVYHPYILNMTSKVLDPLSVITLPWDLRGLVQKVYDEKPVEGSEFWSEWCALHEELNEARRLAKTYLIPDPEPSLFRLATFLQPVRDENDEEGNAASYLAVRTRQGDRSRSILILEGDAFSDVLLQPRSPSRDVLKGLYLNSVSVPIWWFSDTRPASGFEPLTKAPSWMPGYAILRLANGRWEGFTDKGEPFTIVNHAYKGLYRKTERKECDEADLVQCAYGKVDSL
jgi:CRISPR-associated endonuclease/helicase Cas3